MGRWCGIKTGGGIKAIEKHKPQGEISLSLAMDEMKDIDDSNSLSPDVGGFLDVGVFIRWPRLEHF